MHEVNHYSDQGLEVEYMDDADFMAMIEERERKYREKMSAENIQYWNTHEYATNSEQEDKSLVEKFPIFCGPGNYLPDNYEWRKEDGRYRLVRVIDENYDRDRQMASEGYYRDYAGYLKGEKHGY